MREDSKERNRAPDSPSPLFPLAGKSRSSSAKSRLTTVYRRELAKLRDGGGDNFHGEGDIRWRGMAAEAEADRSTGFLGREADGGEDVRGFDGAGRAGGAGGAGQPLQIEGDDESFSFDPGKSDVGRVGGARGAGRVGARMRDFREQAAFESVS